MVPQFKAKMEATYSSPFSANCVWRDLANLKRGRDLVSFYLRFTELARLVGESPDSALYGSRLWGACYEKMTTQEQHTLSFVIHMAQQLGRKPCLRDAMAILDKDNLRHGSAQVIAKPPATGASISLAPGPIYGTRCDCQHGLEERPVRKVQGLRSLVPCMWNPSQLEAQRPSNRSPAGRERAERRERRKGKTMGQGRQNPGAQYRGRGRRGRGRGFRECKTVRLRLVYSRVAKPPPLVVYRLPG